METKDSWFVKIFEKGGTPKDMLKFFQSFSNKSEKEHFLQHLQQIYIQPKLSGLPKETQQLFLNKLIEFLPPQELALMIHLSADEENEPFFKAMVSKIQQYNKKKDWPGLATFLHLIFSIIPPHYNAFFRRQLVDTSLRDALEQPQIRNLFLQHMVFAPTGIFPNLLPFFGKLSDSQRENVLKNLVEGKRREDIVKSLLGSEPPYKNALRDYFSLTENQAEKNLGELPEEEEDPKEKRLRLFRSVIQRVNADMKENKFSSKQKKLLIKSLSPKQIDDLENVITTNLKDGKCEKNQVTQCAERASQEIEKLLVEHKIGIDLLFDLQQKCPTQSLEELAKVFANSPDDRWVDIDKISQRCRNIQSGMKVIQYGLKNSLSFQRLFSLDPPSLSDIASLLGQEGISQAEITSLLLAYNKLLNRTLSVNQAIYNSLIQNLAQIQQEKIFPIPLLQVLLPSELKQEYITIGQEISSVMFSVSAYKEEQKAKWNESRTNLIDIEKQIRQHETPILTEKKNEIVAYRDNYRDVIQAKIAPTRKRFLKFASKVFRVVVPTNQHMSSLMEIENARKTMISQKCKEEKRKYEQCFTDQTLQTSVKKDMINFFQNPPNNALKRLSEMLAENNYSGIGECKNINWNTFENTTDVSQVGGSYLFIPQKHRYVDPLKNCWDHRSAGGDYLSQLWNKYNNVNEPEFASPMDIAKKLETAYKTAEEKIEKFNTEKQALEDKIETTRTELKRLRDSQALPDEIGKVETKLGTFQSQRNTLIDNIGKQEDKFIRDPIQKQRISAQEVQNVIEKALNEKLSAEEKKKLWRSGSINTSRAKWPPSSAYYSMTTDIPTNEKFAPLMAFLNLWNENTRKNWKANDLTKYDQLQEENGNKKDN